MTAPDTIATADGRVIPLSELERVARAATPGPWEADWLGTNHFEVHSLAAGAEFWVLTDASAKGEDLDFIAAANPLTCLALVAEVRRQAEEIANVCAERDALYAEVKARDSEIARLRERVAELVRVIRSQPNFYAAADLLAKGASHE